MPELPEVETTCRGISPYVVNQVILKVKVRNKNLRWPVPKELPKFLKQKTVKNITRRAKYLLFETELGYMFVHLGMSGSLRIVSLTSKPKKHDHIDFILQDNILRFHDPRRFGSVHWTTEDPFQHRLLSKLGPEPLSENFNGEYLYQKAKQKKVQVKNFIMNSHVVVGVGNIYASEALFLSGIHPQRSAGRISLNRYKILVKDIKKVLTHAIQVGGTTLRDFVREDGTPGYFANQLNVYDKTGQPCPNCRAPIQVRKLGQRSSFFCNKCQH